MHDEITYVNHRGQSVVFGYGIFAMESDLRDVEWAASSTGLTSRLSRTRKDRTVPLRLCVEDAGGLEERDRIVDVLDADARAMRPGSIVYNGYALQCYCTGMAFSRYAYRDGYLACDLTVKPVDDVWRRPVTKAFRPTASGSSADLDLPCDLPCDLTAPPAPTSVLVDVTGDDAPFLLRVWGPAVSPRVTIAGNLYGVDATIPDGYYMEIDSAAKTIRSVSPDGEVTDLLRNRVRGMSGSGRYVFERIPAGENPVSWPQTFDFELTVFDERSTPMWHDWRGTPAIPEHEEDWTDPDAPDSGETDPEPEPEPVEPDPGGLDPEA